MSPPQSGESASGADKVCVCGNTDLLNYSPGYFRCARCETLIAARPFDASISSVGDEDTGLYGREYWYAHQAEYGFPNIETRARQDLAERCVYWLKTLLKFKQPPCRVLELGSAHGAFVALLNWAGFDASGLELSPSIVEFARQTFQIPILCGTVETQDIAPASFDVIALFDVLEHLPDPHKTISTCLKLLKPDGMLLIQTPQFPSGLSYEHMLETQHSFLEMLKEQEHLYLFSSQSLERFLHAAGAKYVVREKAIFSQYDQFVLATTKEMPARQLSEASEEPQSDRRLIQALIDSGDRFDKLAVEAEKRNRGQHELTAIIALRDARIVELEQMAQERLTALERAAEAFREAGASQELTAAVAMRDVRIFELEQIAQERLTALERAADAHSILFREADARERGLHELTAIIAARDARIVELEQIAEQRLTALERAAAQIDEGLGREAVLGGKIIAFENEGLVQSIIRHFRKNRRPSSR